MKNLKFKLAYKLIFALVPVFIYLIIFVCFDAYDYFGVQGKTNSNNPIKRVQNYINNPTENIILGDSRFAHFDIELVNDISKKEYSNIAFGGASLEESLDLFDFIYNKNPNLDTVVFELSFYTLNSNYGSVSRMETIETQLENPIAYVSNLEYNVNMLTNIKNIISNAPTDDVKETRIPQEDDYIDINGNEYEYRKDLISYASVLYSKCAKVNTLPKLEYNENSEVINLQTVYDLMLKDNSLNSAFSVDEKLLERLINISNLCKEQGINFIVVFPPMDKTVGTLVCDSLGITEQMYEVLQKLTNSNVQLINYEWVDKYSSDTNFFDGFHIDELNALPQFTEKMFTDIENANDYIVTIGAIA